MEGLQMCGFLKGVSLKQTFALSWHCCIFLDTESYHLCELARPQSEEAGEAKERLIPNQQKTHADMQTQPERGQ